MVHCLVHTSLVSGTTWSSRREKNVPYLPVPPQTNLEWDAAQEVGTKTTRLLTCCHCRGGIILFSLPRGKQKLYCGLCCEVLVAASLLTRNPVSETDLADDLTTKRKGLVLDIYIHTYMCACTYHHTHTHQYTYIYIQIKKVWGKCGPPDAAQV